MQAFDKSAIFIIDTTENSFFSFSMFCAVDNPLEQWKMSSYANFISNVNRIWIVLQRFVINYRIECAIVIETKQTIQVELQIIKTYTDIVSQIQIAIESIICLNNLAPWRQKHVSESN